MKTECSIRTDWLVFIGVICMTMMVNIDISIINLALAKISVYFSTTITEAQWTINIFMLVGIATMIFFGRLADMYGKKYIYIIGIIVFGIGSILAACSWNIWSLIIGRSIQGLGYGISFALGLVIIGDIFPISKRGFVFGCYTTIVGISLAVAPTLGGIILQYMNWRWLFFINIPLVIISVYLLSYFYHPQKIVASKKSIDYIGFVLFAGLMVLLIYGCNNIGIWGLVNVKILSVISITCIIVMTLFLWEKNYACPLIDLSIFKQRRYNIVLLLRFINNCWWGLLIFVIPLYLQNIILLSPLATGLVVLTLPLTYIISSYLFGKIADKLGFHTLIFISTVVLCLSTVVFYISTLTYNIYWEIGNYIIAGISITLILMSCPGMIMEVLPKNKHGIGMGIYSTVSGFSIAFIVGIAGSVIAIIGHNLLSRQLVSSAFHYTDKQKNFLYHAVTGTRSLHQVTKHFSRNYTAQAIVLVRHDFVMGMRIMGYVGIIAAILSLLGGIYLFYLSASKSNRA